MGNKTGTPFAQLQPRRIGQNESGAYSDITYETTDEKEATRYILNAQRNGILFDYEESFGKRKITYHFPYNYQNGSPATEPPTILWELSEQKAEKSILDSANPLANACTQGEIYQLTVLQQNIADFTIVPSDETASPTLQTGTIAYFDTTYDANQTSNRRLAIAAGSAARTLASLIAIGVQSYPVFVPQLKYTTTVNAAYPIQALFTNVGSIISTPSVYSLYNIPANVLFVLPNYLNPAPASGKPVLMYGWYLNSPQVNQIARLKFQITQTMDYGLWPVDLFGTPI